MPPSVAGLSSTVFHRDIFAASTPRMLTRLPTNPQRGKIDLHLLSAESSNLSAVSAQAEKQIRPLESELLLTSERLKG